MSSVNKVLLVCRLGKDPTTKYGANGNPVCTFSVATSENWKDKDGNKQEKTTWHNIVAFGKLADICQKYLIKGKLVYIEGKIDNDKYEKDGTTFYTSKVIANQMQMLGGKNDSGQAEGSPAYGTKDDSDLPF